jgi:hypothetical protein
MRPTTTPAPRRGWHRASGGVLGRHQPALALLVRGLPLLHRCRCGRVAYDLGGELVWLPAQVWHRARSQAR